MTDNEPTTVELNGHNVPADEVDHFLSGRTGEPVTDEEWDESKRRREDAEMLDSDPDNPLVTWAPIDESKATS